MIFKTLKCILWKLIKLRCGCLRISVVRLASGDINHAIRFTLPKEKITKGYITPARHVVNGGNHDHTVPTPFGMRLRLRDTFMIAGFSAENWSS